MASSAAAAAVQTINALPASTSFSRSSTCSHSLQRVSQSLAPCSSSALSSLSQQQQQRSRLLSVRCSAEKVGFFGRLGRVIKEKAKSDVERLFSGFSKTRENLAVVDELLTYWNLSDSENVLDELEEALLVSDFGPKQALKIVDKLRKDILEGKLKTGSEIKLSLKKTIVALLTERIKSSELILGSRRPAVLMIIGVNGGGKTTTLGKLAHRFKKDGTKILMAAGDTFRAAASEQLEVWAERTGSDIVVADKEKARTIPVILNAIQKGKEEDYDIVLCDTSGRLHTNYNLMEELRACKRAVSKAFPGAPHEILMVLDGTTGLNMLPQARQFNEVVGVTGFVLTKLDGTARGGCVVAREREKTTPSLPVERPRSLPQDPKDPGKRQNVPPCKPCVHVGNLIDHTWPEYHKFLMWYAYGALGLSSYLHVSTARTL